MLHFLFYSTNPKKYYKFHEFFIETISIKPSVFRFNFSIYIAELIFQNLVWYYNVNILNMINLFLTSRKIISILQWNLPIADIPNNGHAINSGQNIKSQMWQYFLNYLLIVDTSQQRTTFLRPVGLLRCFT